MEVGVQLLERGSRNIQLTEAGNILRIRAEQILELVKATAKELKDLNEGFHGTLNIGTVASSGATILPQRINTFHKKYPEVDFQIWEGDTLRIMELLNKGIIEIGIVRTPFNSEPYESVSLHNELPRDPMVAVANCQWISEKNSELLDLEELKDKPIIMHRRYAEKITEACREKGFEPKVLCKSDDVRSMLTWAETGLGIAIVPKSTISLITNKELRFREIEEFFMETTVALIWMKNRYLSSVAHHFIENFKS